MRRRRICFEYFSKSHNEIVHCSGIWIVGHIPNLSQQLLSRNDPIGMVQKIFYELEFKSGHVRRFIVDDQLVLLKVNEDVANLCSGVFGGV